jgi:hypothetical protein
MKLHDIAHARAGDKGNTTTLSLIPYKAADYETLKREVTAERVKAHFGAVVQGRVTRYEVPNLPALAFTCEGSLLGGVTVSPGLDPHGKSLSFALLNMEI